MFRNIILSIFLCLSTIIYAQNVGINTTGATPSKNAILDLNTGNSYNTGLIIPHVTLGASLSTFNPPIANAATVNDTGMIVYNMNGVQPVGYYCWNGSSWVSVSNLPTSFNPNALIFEGATANSPLASTANMTYNKNHGTLLLGVGTGTPVFESNSFIDAEANVNSFAQINIHNSNNGNNASCDFVATNDVDSNHYIDMGINSSQYAQAGYSSTYKGQGYVYCSSAALWLESATDTVGITSGGLLKSNRAAYWDGSQVFHILNGINVNGSQGTSGQVLTSQGTGLSPKWTTPAGGGSAWSLTGNSGTIPGTNFIGTTDANALEFKVNGQEAGWIDYAAINANIFLGYLAGQSNNPSGNENAALGYKAFYNNNNGDNNVAIGYSALATNVNGSNNTAVGGGADVSSAGLSNATAIGNGAIASSSNTMVMGNNSVTQFEFNGALMPYNGSYSAGSAGQALISQGAGLSPQWGTIGVTAGGTGSGSFNPNAIIFEGATSTSPLTSSASMTWNSNHSALLLGGTTMQSQAPLIMNGNINSYYQCVIHNANSGSAASCDFIAYNNVDSTNYVDLGINSSTYNQAGYTSEGPGDAYLYSNKSNLVLGTANGASNGVDSIKMTVGGLNAANEALTICPSAITTQVHFAPDSIIMPVHTGAYTPKYVGEKWIYLHGGDSTECTCISTTAGRKVDSVTMGSGIKWISTVTGIGGVTQTCKYYLRHKTCVVDVTISGASSGTSFTFTLPFIAKNTDFQIYGQYTDNGINGYAGVITYTAGNKTASCAMSNGNMNGWTNLGTRAVTGLRISYEIQ